MKAFRILKRNIRDGFKSVGRNFSLSIASISCITITLLIVAIALVVAANVENITKIVKEDFTIVAFLDINSTEEQEKQIKDAISSFSNVEDVTYQSKIDIARTLSTIGAALTTGETS